MKDYNYTVKGNSLFTIAFIKNLIKPLQKLLSRRLPANYLTIIGHISIYVALYFSWEQDVAGQMNLVVISFLIFVHLVCDKLDGFHARTTGTTSALGKFIDHFFEIFNRGALIYIIFNVYNISHGWTVIAAMATTILLMIIQYYGQYKTGTLNTAKIGALELKVLTIVLILVTYLIPVLTFLNQSVYLGYTPVEWLLVTLSLAIVLSSFRSLRNVPEISYGFWLFVTLFAIVAGSATMIYNTSQAGLLVLLYGGLYAGRLMLTQLVDGIERSPGFFAPIFLLIHYAAGYFEADHIFLIIILYLITNILLVVIRVVKAQKNDWYWINPR